MLPYEAYFDRVYDETYRALLRQALLKLSDPFDAEDALQNAYVRFLRRIKKHGFSDISDPGAFLYKSLCHEITQHYAARAVRKERETPLPDAVLPDDGQEVSLRALDAVAVKEIFTLARALPAEVYRTFVLYYGFDMSVAEIARSLGVSEEAVKSRLFRARRSIRSESHKKGDLAL